MQNGEKHKEELWIKAQVIEVRNEKSSKVEKKIQECKPKTKLLDTLFIFLAYRMFCFIPEQPQRNALKLLLNDCVQTNILKIKSHWKKIKVSFNKM